MHFLIFLHHWWSLFRFHSSILVIFLLHVILLVDSFWSILDNMSIFTCPLFNVSWAVRFFRLVWWNCSSWSFSMITELNVLKKIKSKLHIAIIDRTWFENSDLLTLKVFYLHRALLWNIGLRIRLYLLVNHGEFLWWTPSIYQETLRGLGIFAGICLPFLKYDWLKI